MLNYEHYVYSVSGKDTVSNTELFYHRTRSTADSSHRHTHIYICIPIHSKGTQGRRSLVPCVLIFSITKLKGKEIKSKGRRGVASKMASNSQSVDA